MAALAEVYGSLLYALRFIFLDCPFPSVFPMALWCLGGLERLNNPSRI